MSLLNQVLQDLDLRSQPEQRPQAVRLAATASVTGYADDFEQHGGPDWLRFGAWSMIAVAALTGVAVFVGAYQAIDPARYLVQPQTATAAAQALASPTRSNVSSVAAHSGVGRATDRAAAAPLPGDSGVVPGPVPGGAEGVRHTRAGSPDAATVSAAAVNGSGAGDPLRAASSGRQAGPAAVETRPAVAPPGAVNEAAVDAPAAADRYIPLRNAVAPPPLQPRVKSAANDRASNTAVKTPRPAAAEPLADVRQAIAQGDLAEAEVMLQQRLRTAPTDRTARELLVGLMLRGDRQATALQQLDRGLAHDPEHIKFILIKARLLAQNGDTPAALALLEQAPRAASGRVELLQMLGALYQQQGRYRDAVDDYRALLAMTPDSGPAWVGLAISLDGLGDPGAAEAYRRALQLGGLPAAAESYARTRSDQLGSGDG
ncbi:MAG: hypothetical protein LJE59_03085 [Chromatiaceae bacterium]|nr:hypothetical protein [Chromatiaceae bacterium]